MLYAVSLLLFISSLNIHLLCCSALCRQKNIFSIRREDVHISIHLIVSLKLSFMSLDVIVAVLVFAKTHVFCVDTSVHPSDHQSSFRSSIVFDFAVVQLLESLDLILD